ncbi:cysteine synthase A [Phenylobacterium sp.]|uniref:cysteine synthase A n=1 Tax=Phenylobacterium sp. TaxID=1871053 RepID=UPI002FC980ED
MAKFQNILETVGDTPVVRINRLAPAHVNLYAKVEAFNPLGSVKDRLALGVIEAAEKSGALKPGQTVIEATSGNTGIGLAMVCAQKGYPLVVVMADSFSVERRKLMRFLGAKLVLTPAAHRGTGMVAKAVELAQKHGWFLTRQFENEANPDTHSATTAREILRDFEGERLDYWVTGYGTGGTLKGVGRVLRQERPETKIVVCEPQDAPLLGSGAPQARNPDGSASDGHPAWKPHPMQGWTPDFIPKLTGDAVDMGLADMILPIEMADAMGRSKDLAQKEGVFVGITAGATLAGALRVARDAPQGANILCMLPDTGERYLSTPLFADVSIEMTPEELEIARSSPMFADVPTPA